MRWIAATLLAVAAGSFGADAAAPAAAPQAQGAEEITPRLVATVGRGLEYLAQAPQKDGSWIGNVGFKLNQDYRVQEQDVPHVGVTALCGMAFLAGGHLPDRGKYGPTLDRAITFLLGQVNDQGFITAHHTRMYDHAFGTLFLAEVFGQTNRSDVRAKLQQAVDLIVSSQNVKGSWRYEPFALESDMSITVCQLMALRAARNVGIKVSKDTIDHAVLYVRLSQVREDVNLWQQGPDDYYMMARGAFKYQYQEEGDMSRSSFALTAAGITSLYHAAEYDTKSLKDSLNFLEESMERVSRPQWRNHFFYWYGHYYAVQAMFITGNLDDTGGKAYWTRYWRHVSGELLEQGGDFGQGADGSWPNPVGPGRNFATAVALIVLQTPYRYLPILQR
jgi:hypothetical protein